MIGDLDPVIHAPKRLAAMAVLSTSSAVTFGFLRDHLEISDSDLSKQMATLEKAGYVSSSRSGRGRGSVTSYRLTRAGRRAYEGHRRALTAILESPPSTEPTG
ncbi:transcriptional regulator [Nocardioides ferulae]|uniref:transcriptional regulator n=1 Tax=Nocardioides ferulae TaxID=2340821 RepID=UPI00197FA1D8|nr:transcriptional regulator [Nocardioides ferulae]